MIKVSRDDSYFWHEITWNGDIYLVYLQEDFVTQAWKFLDLKSGQFVFGHNPNNFLDFLTLASEAEDT